MLDHLNQIVHQDGDKAPNFVSAGCTLDASIKIYSCRVDAVHSDTYRVWGGFSKSAPELKEDEEDQEAGQKEKSGGVHGFGDDEVDGDGDNSVLSVSTPTTKKSHKKRSSTIEAHPESLLQKKPERSYYCVRHVNKSIPPQMLACSCIDSNCFSKFLQNKVLLE